MAKSETWYDRQAFISKLITYSAMIILLGSIGWAAYSAYLSHKDDQAAAKAVPQSATTATTMPTTAETTMSATSKAVREAADYHAAMFSVMAGIATSAFLIGISAIIDLLIVQCEALRNRR